MEIMEKKKVVKQVEDSIALAIASVLSVKFPTINYSFNAIKASSNPFCPKN